MKKYRRRGEGDEESASYGVVAVAGEVMVSRLPHPPQLSKNGGFLP